MNQTKPKSNEKFQTQTSTSLSTAKHAPVKRKRDEEPFQRMVMPKSTPSYDLQNKKITTMKLPALKQDTTATTSTKKFSTDSESQIKKSIQGFSQNYKKNTSSRDLQPIEAVKKKPTENSIFNKNAKPVLNGKKLAGDVKKEYDSTMVEVKKFDKKIDPLLTDLKALVEELEDKANPLLKKSEEKLEELQKTVEKTTGEHREKMIELNLKLKAMRDSRLALSQELAEKMKTNSGLTSTKKRHELDIELYNRTIEENRRHLQQVAQKNQDLNNFIRSIEDAIKTTKAKAKTRFGDKSIEEKKMMIIEELIHLRKQNIRPFLLLREIQAPQDNSSLFKIIVNECRRRIKVEITQNEEKGKSRFFDYEGIYTIDNYQQRDDELFQNQDQILYKNIFSSIFETEEKSGYFFIMLSKDNYIGKMIKNFFNSILCEHVDPNFELNNIADVKFDHGGKVLSESVNTFGDFKERIQDESFDFKHRLFTFEVKLANNAEAKRFTFIVINPEEIEFIDTMRVIIEKHKNKSNSLGNAIEATPLGNENILDFIKTVAPMSAHYSFLAIESQGVYAENPESNQNNCIDLLLAFNRLRN